MIHTAALVRDELRTHVVARVIDQPGAQPEFGFFQANFLAGHSPQCSARTALVHFVAEATRDVTL